MIAGILATSYLLSEIVALQSLYPICYWEGPLPTIISNQDGDRMSYDEDVAPRSRPKSVLTNDDALKLMILILSLLMIVIGLPSLFSGIYENPLPGIALFGFLAIILTLFYMTNQIRRTQEMWNV